MTRGHDDNGNGRRAISTKTMVMLPIGAAVTLAGFVWAISAHEAGRDAAIDKQNALNGIRFAALEREIEDLRSSKLSKAESRERWNLFRAQLPPELRSAVPEAGGK